MVNYIYQPNEWQRASQFIYIAFAPVHIFKLIFMFVYPWYIDMIEMLEMLEGEMIWKTLLVNLMKKAKKKSPRRFVLE